MLREVDKLTREGQEYRDAVKGLQDQFLAGEAELDDVRGQQRALEAEATERAAPDGGGDVRTLAERVGIPKAFFERADVVAKKAGIEAALAVLEQLRAAAAAHAAAEQVANASSYAAGAADEAGQGIGAHDERMAMAAGDDDAVGDPGSAARRKRFA